MQHRCSSRGRWVHQGTSQYLYLPFSIRTRSGEVFQTLAGKIFGSVALMLNVPSVQKNMKMKPKLASVAEFAAFFLLFVGAVLFYVYYSGLGAVDSVLFVIITISTIGKR
jgi:uncharacterized membrane protein YfcA